MTARRIVLHTREERALGEVLTELGGDATKAVGEGRVFIGRERARSASERVKPGVPVTVHPAAEPARGARILDRRGDVVALYKPAGMPTIADHRGATVSLQYEAARLLGIDPDSLHPTSRLDVNVSGVVLFALSKLAGARLLDARARGVYVRHYVALASGVPSPEEGVWAWAIGRARDPRKRMALGRDAVPAQTRYTTISTAARGAALLLVMPQTGRTHQIRVHAAHAKTPLLGDAAYGGPSRVTSPDGTVTRVARIGLHAAKIEVPDAAGKPFSAAAPIPDDLRELWRLVGGEPSAWVDALERAG